jgi:hypothetical protein
LLKAFLTGQLRLFLCRLLLKTQHFLLILKACLAGTAAIETQKASYNPQGSPPTAENRFKANHLVREAVEQAA